MKGFLLIGLCLFCGAAYGQSLPKVDTLRWKHYSGGYVIDLPNLFKYGIRTHTGIEWFTQTDTSIHGEYELCVDCGEQETEVVSPGTIKASFENRKKEYLSSGDILSYELLKPKFFVLSGYLKADRVISYLKGINHKGRYYELSIRYEPRFKPLFDSILPRIAASFH